MTNAELATQTSDLLVKAAPPLTVTGLTLWGIALPDVVAVLTIIYLLIHIGYIVKKWIKGE